MTYSIRLTRRNETVILNNSNSYRKCFAKQHLTTVRNSYFFKIYSCLIDGRQNNYLNIIKAIRQQSVAFKFEYIDLFCSYYETFNLNVVIVNIRMMSLIHLSYFKYVNGRLYFIIEEDLYIYYIIFMNKLALCNMIVFEKLNMKKK